MLQGAGEWAEVRPKGGKKFCKERREARRANRPQDGFDGGCAAVGSGAAGAPRALCRPVRFCLKLYHGRHKEKSPRGGFFIAVGLVVPNGLQSGDLNSAVGRDKTENNADHHRKDHRHQHQPPRNDGNRPAVAEAEPQRCQKVCYDRHIV